MQRPQRRVLHTHGGARNAPAFLLFGIFLLIGLGLLGGAALLVVDTRSDIARADKADGSVIALIGERDSDGDTMYYPRVRYVTRSGNPVEFTGSVGSSPAAFDVGEPVAVLYDPAEPEGARIDSFFQLWFAALILGGIGLVFAAIGGGGGLVAWRHGPDRRSLASDLRRSMPTAHRSCARSNARPGTEAAGAAANAR